MKKFRISLSPRRLALWISAAASAVVCLILCLISSGMGAGLEEQQMARRWSERKDVSQISCFFSPDAGMDVDSIESFRHGVDSALVEASITQESPNPGARLWADAYSADGQVTLVSDRASVTADALGVGGDFFLFHPLRLLYGSYFSESDLNQDLCVIDEDAAWQLFGSSNVAGQNVTIGGIPHIIAGVVHREEGFLREAAGLDGTVVYVSYATLADLGRNNGINHYEIVMPNPVKGYAYNYVQEHIGVDEKYVEVVENSTRYGLKGRLETLSEFGTRAMNRKALIYPYWENLARGYEDVIAILTLFAFIFLLYPAAVLVVSAVIYWRHKSWTLKGCYLFLRDKWERKLEKERAKRLRRKAHRNKFDEEEEYL